MKKIFTLFAIAFVVLTLGACTKEAGIAPQNIVDEAADLIYEYNKPGIDNQLVSNFTRVSKLDYEGYIMDVAWAVTGVTEEYVKVVPNAEANEVTIEVNKYIDANATVTITATVSSGENSKSVVFTYTMKAYIISDWAYWAANPTGVTMNIRGVVVAKDVYSDKYGNAGVYLQDFDGIHGYYAYGLTCTKAQYNSDLAIGNVIEVTGTTKMYNNFREFDKGCTYNLVKDDEGVIETRAVTPVDITADLIAGVDLNKYQGNLVTLKDVKVKQVLIATALDETQQKGAVNVIVEKGGKDIISRMYTSNTFTYAAIVTTMATLQTGYTVDVVGPMAWYNEAQIYPLMEGGYTIKSTEVTAQDYLDMAVAQLHAKYDELAVTGDITLDATIGATDHEATLTWVSSNTAVIANDGTVTLPDAETTVEFTVTVAIGTLSVSETISMTVEQLPVSTIASLIPLTPAKATDPKIPALVEGVVIGHQYKGYWIADETGAALVWLNAAVSVGVNAPAIGQVVSLKVEVTTYGEANSFTTQFSPVGTFTVLEKTAPTTIAPITVTFDTMFGLGVDTLAEAKTAATTYYGKFITITGTLVRMGNDNYWKIQDPSNADRWFRLNSLGSNTAFLGQDGKAVTVTVLVREIYFINDTGSYDNYRANTFGGVYVKDTDVVIQPAA
ncbi:MAG: hypothetical protein PHY42_02500 [Bacilli bacterium]|nr:hypothetical protein [Bacilli bacterium]